MQGACRKLRLTGVAAGEGPALASAQRTTTRGRRAAERGPMIPWMKVARTVALLLVGAVGCTHPRPAGAGSANAPALRLGEALVELDTGAYAPATQELQALAQAYPQHVIGRQALLLTAAAELDPRNPGAQLDEAAGLLTQYLAAADTSDWTRPVARTLYLLALQVGASAQQVEQAEADAARARAEAGRVRAALPRLPGPSLSARITDAEQQRDRLLARVKELEAGSAQLQKALADSAQELKRIRRTLRP